MGIFDFRYMKRWKQEANVLARAGAPIMVVDRDYTVKYMNSSCAALLGRTPGTMYWL